MGFTTIGIYEIDEVLEAWSKAERDFGSASP